MEIRKEQDHYEERFNPQVFLKQRFKTPGTPMNQFRDIRLKLIHNLFGQVSSNNTERNDMKILDYGAGPVVAFAISAAGNECVSEIVLAEYTENNREALHKWIDRKNTAFDWTAYFKHVVLDLEKKTESDVSVREERLRSLVKVASCDITDDRPIEKGFEGPYDVVLTHLAIESACKTEEEFTTFIEKLSKLVKPGGLLYMFSKQSSTESQSMYYELGGENFYYYAVTSKTCLDALQKSGFGDIQVDEISIAETISGLSESETAELEIHPTSDEFFYASILAKKF